MRRIIPTLLLAASALFLLGLNPAGRLASSLEEACQQIFLPSTQEGKLGRLAEDREPNRLYQRYDPLLGAVVLVTTDSNGNLDPRPLGEGSVFECAFGKVEVGPNQSAMCRLEDGKFTPLDKGDRAARSRNIYRFSFRLNWWDQPPVNRFHWEQAREVRLKRRDPRALLPVDAQASRDLASRKVIVPGQSVPRFYRTDKQYWKLVKGEVFAVPKGFWMQRFMDGNFHQVKLDHHLEPWPGEPESVVEVPDRQEWIKVGKNNEAYVLIEPLKRSRVDWVRYYAPGTERSTNRKISAAWACRTCTGGIRQPKAETPFDEVPDL